MKSFQNYVNERQLKYTFDIRYREYKFDIHISNVVSSFVHLSSINKNLKITNTKSILHFMYNNNRFDVLVTYNKGLRNGWNGDCYWDFTLPDGRKITGTKLSDVLKDLLSQNISESIFPNNFNVSKPVDKK